MLFLALECENREPLLHANQEEQLTAAAAASAEGICTVAFLSAGTEVHCTEHRTAGPRRNCGSTQVDASSAAEWSLEHLSVKGSKLQWSSSKMGKIISNLPLFQIQGFLPP